MFTQIKEKAIVNGFINIPYIKTFLKQASEAELTTSGSYVETKGTIPGPMEVITDEGLPWWRR